MESEAAALAAVLASVDDVHAAYVAWNAASPGWKSGPELQWRNGQLQPTDAALARTRVPLLAEVAPRWTATPLPGLASFRQTVNAELRFVREAAPGTPSNAVYLEAFWREALHALSSYGPLTALNANSSISFPNSTPTTVHIVTRNGSHWIRLLPVRLDALEREWRDENESRADHAGHAPDTLLKTAHELLAARTTQTVELVLTRLSLADAGVSVPSTAGADTGQNEPLDVAARLAMTVRTIEQMGVHVRFGTASTPLTLRLPRPPSTSFMTPPLASSVLNVDVSALIALTSDLSHGYTVGLHIHANRALQTQAKHEQASPLLPHLAAHGHGTFQLVATEATLSKFQDIVEKVASPREAARAKWLCAPRHGPPPHGPHQEAWLRLFPDPIRVLPGHQPPPALDERPLTHTYLRTLLRLEHRTAPKSLGASHHTWQALHWGISMGITTLLAHAHGVHELAEAAGGAVTQADPPGMPPLLWLIQPRSFVSHDVAQVTRVPTDRSDSASSNTDLLEYMSSGMHDQRKPKSTVPTRPRTRLQRLWEWSKGPSIVRPTPIKHYLWWPFGGLEAAWMRLTAPVAWKEPVHDLDEMDITTEEMELHPIAEHWTPPAPHTWQGWRRLQRDWALNMKHWIVLAALCIGWLFGFSVLVDNMWFQGEVQVQGVWTSPQSFACSDALWGRNAYCGLDGASCAPFSDTSFPFRCPSGCLGTTLLNSRTVGSLQYNYRPLVVGGGPAPYRADSFLCAAAQHAGVIGNRGGCGVIRMVGTYVDYPSVTQNGVASIPFSGVFPSSFYVDAAAGQQGCIDERWKLYVLDVVMTALVALVLRPMPVVLLYAVCADPSWILSIVGFWHVNLVSELRDLPPPVGDAVGDFGPYLFVCFIIWKYGLSWVWPAFRKLPLEFGIFSLGLWWIGVLLDVVFADVPLQRLEAHDIAQQPGALTSLIVIILVIVGVGINQVIVMRNAGVLHKFVTLYVLAGVILGLCAAVPGEGIRLHHYIIAIALLPACCFPTRLSLLASSILFGMFINGVARWGFDGLLQDVKVIQGDATSETALPVFKNSTNSGNGIIAWDPISPALAREWSGFALLVDDVLRYQGPNTEYNMSSLVTSFADENSELMSANNITNALMGNVHYLRLAFASAFNMGDFTTSALAWMNGTLIPPGEGRT